MNSRVSVVHNSLNLVSFPLPQVMIYSISLFVTIAICICPPIHGFRSFPRSTAPSRSSILRPKMALDDFFLKRLDSIKRTFEALTERLADPDVANDRKQMLVLSRERAAVEKTMDAYDEWKVSCINHRSLFHKSICSV